MKGAFSKLNQIFFQKKKRKKEEIKTNWTPGTNFSPTPEASPRPI
jgi:hypothetical protein